MTFLRRLPVILLGLIAAGAAAAGAVCVIAFITGWFGAAEWEFLAANFAEIRMHTSGIAAKAGLAASMLALPFLGAILLIEKLRLRSLLWYGAMGVALAVAANLMFGFLYARYVPSGLMAPAIFRPGTPMLTLLLAGALVAAAVYWLVAGRNAGERAHRP